MESGARRNQGVETAVTDHGWERWTEQVDWTDWRSWLRKAASTDWASAPWPSAPWEQAAAPGGISLSLRAVEDDELGRNLTATWPAFRLWWRDGPGTRPTAGQAGARLDEHMPELVPAWRRLTGLLGEDPEAAATLALWNPPPFLTGCSQAAVLPDGPALIRNYDWDHRLFDAVVARTVLTGPGCSACSTACGVCWTGSTTPACRLARLRWPARSVRGSGSRSWSATCWRPAVDRRGDARCADRPSTCRTTSRR